jgi:mono/diheme cytochrome c family protein
MLSKRDFIFLLSLLLFSVCGFLVLRKKPSMLSKSAPPADIPIHLLEARSSPYDLEISGDLADLPPGSKRFLTRETLLSLPQIATTVTNDANFSRPTKVSGVYLRELVNRLAQNPGADMVSADCDDLYQAHYPRNSISIHHPILVLLVNDQPPANWPKSLEGSGSPMSPYLISHPAYVSSFQIFRHGDEAQIPWGVVRLEFRDEEKVFSPIAPPTDVASDRLVNAGYLIAKQNCFRCHNIGDNARMKSGVPWQTLVAWAASAPAAFGSYVRDPQSADPHAQMPANPEYDRDTLDALTAYFSSLSNRGKP